MTCSINDIENDLMALPRQDRARIGLDLIRSLDKDDESLTREEWEAAWREEIQRRVQDVHEGRVELLDAEQVITDLRARHPKNKVGYRFKWPKPFSIFRFGGLLVITAVLALYAGVALPTPD